LRKQPFSKILAKQRAYALKQSYVTCVLNDYVFKNKITPTLNIVKDSSDNFGLNITEEKKVIKDVERFSQLGFEAYICEQFSSYIGMSQYDLKGIFNIQFSPKHLNKLLVSAILKVKDIEDTEEFQKANIKVKTICLEADGVHIIESMSFPTFRFKEIITQTWGDSAEFQYFVEQKYFFIVFRKDTSYDSKEKEKHIFLDSVFLWQLPEIDEEKVKEVWEKAVNIIKTGVKFKGFEKCSRIENNLPKQSESQFAHVRPHSGKSGYKINGKICGNLKYANELPNGDWMTNQCFWLNSGYLEKQISLMKSEKNYP